MGIIPNRSGPKRGPTMILGQSRKRRGVQLTRYDYPLLLTFGGGGATVTLRRVLGAR